jgi:hypothetical protein
MENSLPSSRLASLDLSCSACNRRDFEIRAVKDDDVATLRCIGCGRDYLLLDSEDYWFDVIQAGYPRLSRCGCKSISFAVRCDYQYRDDGDVRSIDVWRACSSCQKVNRLMSLDIDYEGTEDLVRRPLRYCKNPKILYDLQQLTLYATRDDIVRVVDFLNSEHNCAFVCWLREQDKWVRHDLSSDETGRAVLRDRDRRYLRIYALPNPIDILDADVDTLKQEDIFWKRHEVIRISSPTNVGMDAGTGLLFYINFSNEFVDDEMITQKSRDFLQLTKSLVAWLGTEFVSWRGPRCFDNRNEHLRLFGDRFVAGKMSQ